MLNGDLKDKALEELKVEERKREQEGKRVIAASEVLYKKRQNVSVTIIPLIEEYVNSIANTPKEFDAAVEKLHVSYNKFRAEIKIAEDASNEAKIVGKTTGTGVAVGVGVAALAPSAAMAVATTFGAASTGTAISALSGAAATNAALAWIGGGALTAGGGGMVAGNALLALSGPIGWSIGAVSLIGGGYAMREKNRKFAEEANNVKIEVVKETAILHSSLLEINMMIREITEHSNGVLTQLKLLKGSNWFTSTIKKITRCSYNDFSKDEKKQLMALVNNVNSLSTLLVKNVKR